MLVICEDCAKKYSIDERRIKVPRVKFKCRACNHIIIVEKPKIARNDRAEYSAEKKKKTERKEKKEKNVADPAEPSSHTRPSLRHPAAAVGKGIPFSLYLSAVMLAGLFIVSVFFVHCYLKTVPDALQQQQELRGRALTESLKRTIIPPLLRKDYLTVNQEVKRTCTLPGVAYAAVSNKKGIIVAGFFSNLNKFETHFSGKVKEKGFPSDILTKNTVPPGEKEAGAMMETGGVPVYDRAAVLPDGGGELHVGLYAVEFEKYFFKHLVSPLTLILLLLFILSVYILFVLFDKFITEPVRVLTNTANRISLGELNLSVTTAGPKEIRELGAALERMRHSIKVAMERLR